MTMPFAGASTGAFSSSTSAWSSSLLQQIVDPLPVFADTETKGESPPYSSGTTDCATSSCLTLSGLASCFVDLVDRHYDRDLGRLRVMDRFDRLRHDAVVSRDHQNTMSVTLAPRARIAVNAS